MSKKLKLYKMIDKTDSNTTQKDIIDNVPVPRMIMWSALDSVKLRADWWAFTIT